MRAVRTHDSFYLLENHSQQPKEYFKEAANIISRLNLLPNPDISLLDIGSAAGDFLCHIKKLSLPWPTKLYGCDVMSKLVDESRRRIQDAQIEEYDISASRSIASVFKKKFDIITMLGVHSIFDELTFLENIIDGLTDQGTAIIFGIFNPFEYDVLVKVRKHGNLSFESGWNVHSTASISEKCDDLGAACSFFQFEPDIEIPINQLDGLRSYTLNIAFDAGQQIVEYPEEDRKRIFTNATRIIHDWHFCIIHKL